jgi:hypothetical protein
VPPDDDLRLDDGERFSPVGPESGKQDPECPVSVDQAGPFGVPLQDIELMTKREVLQDQRTAGLQCREKRAGQKNIIDAMI